MKLLVIEDELELSVSICSYLANEQFICERATDFDSAIEKISLYDYACIVLDVNLPGGSGLDILKELKNQNKIDGVVIISARNSLDDKVFALKAGADDYLTKPFHLPELAARIAAIIRRKSFDGKNQITVNEITIDLSEKTVRIHDKDIDLTKKEYELLVYFISNRNRVVAKNAIAEHLWGDNMDLAGSYDFIYTHIKNIRKKLMMAGGADCIKSVYGMGYKFTT
ncbi:MAG TPA: response regulator transcription factor [Chitinophagaceae bacterium]|nr:response regulator transcription factor [Chitinophagaceae bacterium]